MVNRDGHHDSVDVTPKKSFLSVFQKVSAQKNIRVDQIGVAVKVSKIYFVNAQQKVIVTLQMVDDKGSGYWCFKADLFGLLYSAASEVLELKIPEFDNIASFFKRSVESPAKIEMWCSSPSKLKALKPEVHGNKVLCFSVCGSSKESVISRVKDIVKCIDSMNQRSEMRSTWLPQAFNSGVLSFTPSFQNSAINDSGFWKIMKANCHVEFEVCLDSVLVHSNIVDAVKAFFNASEESDVSLWSQDLIDVAFSSGLAPLQF